MDGKDDLKEPCGKEESHETEESKQSEGGWGWWGSVSKFQEYLVPVAATVTDRASKIVKDIQGSLIPDADGQIDRPERKDGNGEQSSSQGVPQDDLVFNLIDGGATFLGNAVQRGMLQVRGAAGSQQLRDAVEVTKQATFSAAQSLQSAGSDALDVVAVGSTRAVGGLEALGRAAMKYISPTLAMDEQQKGQREGHSRDLRAYFGEFLGTVHLQGLERISAEATLRIHTSRRGHSLEDAGHFTAWSEAVQKAMAEMTVCDTGYLNSLNKGIPRNLNSSSEQRDTITEHWIALEDLQRDCIEASRRQNETFLKGPEGQGWSGTSVERFLPAVADHADGLHRMFRKDVARLASSSLEHLNLLGSWCLEVDAGELWEMWVEQEQLARNKEKDEAGVYLFSPVGILHFVLLYGEALCQNISSLCSAYKESLKSLSVSVAEHEKSAEGDDVVLRRGFRDVRIKIERHLEAIGVEMGDSVGWIHEGLALLRPVLTAICLAPRPGTSSFSGTTQSRPGPVPKSSPSPPHTTAAVEGDENVPRNDVDASENK